VQITVVGDTTKSLLPGPTYSTEPAFLAALNALKKVEFVAGQDDSRTLVDAVKNNASHNLRSVLWIHAAQPIHEAKKEELQNILKSNKNHFVLNDFTVCAGPQEMLEGAIPSDSLVMVPRYDAVHSDLQSLFKSWTTNPEANGNEFRRSQITPPIAAAYMTDASLAQLFAYQEVLAELQTAKSSSTAPSSFLASKYHFVSPVSSAIVTNVPVNEEKTVGTAVAPEAETWLLLIVALGIISFAVYENKRKPRRSPA